MKKQVMGFGAAVALAVAIGYHVGGARASGIPTNNTLSYTGTLMNNGQPENGSHFILLKMWVGQTLACSTIPSGNTQISNGRFTIPLDASCVPVIHQNQNVEVEVVLDGNPMGRTAIAAVPYAVEADTASNFAPGSAIASLVPPGTIVSYAGVVGGNVNPPPGWLLCDGAAVSRTQYAGLFTAIGTGWGGGDGATTFNLPDMRGRFLRGVDMGAGHDPDATSRIASQPAGNVADNVGSLEGDSFALHGHGGTFASGNHYHYLPIGVSYGQAVLGFTEESSGHSGYTGTFTTSTTIPRMCTVSGCSMVSGASISRGSSGPPSATATVSSAGGAETRPVNVAVNYIIKL